MAEESQLQMSGFRHEGLWMCSWMLVVLPRVAHFVCTKELIPLCSPSTHSDIPVFFFVVLGSSTNLPSSCLLFFPLFYPFLILDSVRF
jgi:hypothetical protein